MMSTQRTTDRRNPRPRVPCCRATTRPVTRLAGTPSGDLLLVDERGAPLGIIVAPRPGMRPAVSGATVYLQRARRSVRGCPDHAA